MSARAPVRRRLRKPPEFDHSRNCLEPPSDSAAYRSLCNQAFPHFLRSDAQLRKEFRLSAWPYTAWDLEQGTLTYLDESGPRVVMTVEVVGSYSHRGGTWLWSWANPSTPSAVTTRMARVREYGRTHGLPQLVVEHWHAEEPYSHEMTAITAFLLGARGGYRTGDEVPGARLSMVIIDAQWAV
jgi:hypothetical protein